LNPGASQNGGQGREAGKTDADRRLAGNPAGAVPGAAAIAVSKPAPRILRFAADPENIPEGQHVATISWQVGDAAWVRIEPGIGPVGLEGSKSVAVDKTTKFTIRAGGPGPEVFQEVSVNVTPRDARQEVCQALHYGDERCSQSSWVAGCLRNSWPGEECESELEKARLKCHQHEGRSLMECSQTIW
jgi:hypothetical protein